MRRVLVVAVGCGLGMSAVPGAASAKEPADMALVVEKRPSSRPLPGERLEFEYRLENRGPLAQAPARVQITGLDFLEAVSVTVTGGEGCRPDGEYMTVCSFSAVKVGEPQRIYVSGGLAKIPPPEFVVSASTGTYTPSDPIWENNHSDIAINPVFNGETALRLNVEAAKRGTLIPARDRAVYVARLVNTGTKDTAPTRLYVSADRKIVKAPGCEISGRAAVCSIGRLVPGQTKSINVDTGKVAKTALVEPQAVFSAEFEGSRKERPPKSVARRLKVAAADLQITGKTRKRGANRAYTLTVVNKGPAAARKVLLKTRGFSRSWKTLAPRKQVTVRFAAKGKHVIIVTSKTLDPRKKNNRFKG